MKKYILFLSLIAVSCGVKKPKPKIDESTVQELLYNATKLSDFSIEEAKALGIDNDTLKMEMYDSAEFYQKKVDSIRDLIPVPKYTTSSTNKE